MAVTRKDRNPGLTELDRELDGGRGGVFRVDFGEIWAAVYRSRWIVLSIVAGCIILGLLVTLLTTPVYRATGTIQIDQEAAKVLGTEQSDVSASIQDAERFLQTQLDVINSRATSIAVAEDLRLFNNLAFFEQMGESGEIAVSSTVPPPQARREAVLKILAENMSVSLPRGSRVASIQFDSPDAALSARVANSYIDNFIRGNLQRKFETSAYAREFLGGQLKQAQARLEQSERAVVAFARRTRIVDASNAAAATEESSQPRSLTTATLVELNQSYSESVAKRLAAEQEWARARATPLLNQPEVLANPAVQELIQERALRQSELEEQLSKRRDAFPAVQQLRARLGEIDQQVGGLARSIRDSIRTRYTVAAAQEQAVRRQVEQLKNSTLGEQSAGVELSVLRREADTNRQQFETLLRRFNQLSAESGVQANNIAVIDRAAVPVRPTWPKAVLNIALALVAGFILSGAYLFLREQFFGRVRTPDDVEDRLGEPVIGAIPIAHGDARDELRDPKSPISEAFNSLRAALSLASADGLPKVLGFTSTQKGEGKSTACYATALTLARTGKRVAVVDFDLRLPNQHKLFGLPHDRGVTDLLTNAASIEAVAQATEFANVTLIASGPVPPNPTDLLQNERLHALLKSLADHFDVVLVDGPPVLGIADAVVIGAAVETTVFVVHSGRNSPKAIARALRRLNHADAQVAGILLQRFNPKQVGYTYGDNHAYQYHYKS